MSDMSEQEQSAHSAVHKQWRDLVVCRQTLETRIAQGTIEQAEAAFAELTAKTCAYDQLLNEQTIQMQALLGRNFLGADEWRKGFGVDVGRPPPVPEHITELLLQSYCPLLPNRRIKDTHILVLMPKTVNGNPYTPLALDSLCRNRQAPGSPLIYPHNDDWKATNWARDAQERIEWILMPRRDPDPGKVQPDRHFRGKRPKDQERVYKTHYQERYRPAKAIEVMTAVLLDFATTGEPRMLAPKGTNRNLLLCNTHNTGSGVSVGGFDAQGLKVLLGAIGSESLGFALVWK